jgi:hydroxymethylpyrimidine pyrophosphatase-like HAD family hydrolase
MKRLICKILREEIEKSDRHYKMLDKISEYVEIPYFDLMEGLTIYDKDDQEYIMKKILGNDIYIRGNVIRNENGKIIYIEKSDGDWVKREYDDKGNNIYQERSDGYWNKWEYDYNGKRIYWEDSDGRITDRR